MQRDPRATHRRKCKEYHVRRHQMGGSTTVSADESREILIELTGRMSHSAIARAIGTSHNYITKIIAGDIKRVSPKRAAQIEAARAHRPTDSGHVSPLGARRRLQALHALGYSWSRISQEIGGYSLGGIKRLVAGDSPAIEAQHDQLVRALYDRLSMKLPVAANPHEASGIARARNTAKRNGWPPPLAWDDPDDPTEQPTTVAGRRGVDDAVVERILSGDFTLAATATPDERRVIVARWRADGRAVNELERATGWQPQRYSREVA